LTGEVQPKASRALQIDQALVERIVADWRLATPPIRPYGARLEVFRAIAAGAGSALVMGSTPELIDLLVRAKVDRVAAIDAHAETQEAMRRLASEDWSRVELVVADWRHRRPRWDAAFERVLCHGGLHFVAFPDGWREVLGIFHGYLRPGGRLVTSSFSVALTAMTARDAYTEAVAAFEAERPGLGPERQERRFAELVSWLKGVTLHGAVEAGGMVCLDRSAEAARWIATSLRQRYSGPAFDRIIQAIFGRSNPVGRDGANLIAAPTREQVEAEMVRGGFDVEVLASDRHPPRESFALAATRRR
jgi:hypothetical protein